MDKQPLTALEILVQQQDRESALFGCTAAVLDEMLATMAEPRDIARYAMGTLSNAQELIRRREYEGTIEYSVRDQDANTIRQLINIAKYAIDKAVPRVALLPLVKSGLSTVKARAVRKGQVVKIYGVPVRVTKREKWNARNVKIHFEDAGFGVPPEYKTLTFREVFLQLDTELDLHEQKAVTQ